MKNMKKTVLLALSFVLVAVISIAGTIAYMTDRDNATNVFTVGNVEIELNEKFEQGAQLMPGEKIEKEATITNTGDNDAWVWMTVAVPAALDEYTGAGEGGATNILHWNIPGEYWYGSTPWQNGTAGDAAWDVNPASIPAVKQTIEGEVYNVYTLLYKKAIKPGETTNIGLSRVYLDTSVDYNKNDGKFYQVEDGVATEIPYDIANTKVYVNAYAMQTEGIASVEEAYAAYGEQWGLQ